MQSSFRAYSTSKARAAEVEAAAAAAVAEAEDEVLRYSSDDMAHSRDLDGTVGATSIGRVGYRK